MEKHMEKNRFTEAMGFENKGQLTFTENGATGLFTTGSLLVDQFGLAGNYRGRGIEKVFEDQRAIWDEIFQSSAHGRTSGHSCTMT